MATFRPQTEDKLRRGFKLLNRLVLAQWHLGLGPMLNALPKVLGRYLVIVHTGRKSGLRRQTPVNFAQIDSEIYVTAGFGRIADWYRNLMANPQAEIWLPDGWYRVVAEDVSDQPQRLYWMRQVLIGSGFASFAAGINPYQISDADLEAATRAYRLLRLRRTAPRTGPGGPGELAWIWPLATILLLVQLRRRRK